MHNNKGVVLIMVLWVLVVLSLIAWGLGRRSSLEVSLLETYRGKLLSYAAARGGINSVLDLLQRSPSPKDTLYSAGVAIDQSKVPSDIFSHMEIGADTYATVEWPAANYNTGDNAAHLEYGLRDEGGRININALGINNYQILSALFQLKGLSQPEGDKLAMAVVNYTGINAAAGNNNSFMNMDNSVLMPKNRHYENVLELLEVNGMTKEIFDRIKDDVTVYGDAQKGLWINTQTANNDVLQAVANGSARLNPAINPSDVTAQAYALRDGQDNISFTQDDGIGSVTAVSGPGWPVALQEGSSNYYRARVVGVDQHSGVRTVLEAVIHHRQGADPEIISWQRE